MRDAFLYARLQRWVNMQRWDLSWSLPFSVKVDWLESSVFRKVDMMCFNSLL